MRNSKKLQIETHSRTYKLVFKAYKIGCSYCGWHSGCNSTYRNHTHRSWKQFRKKQYKL